MVEASFCRYKSQLYWSKSLAALVAKWQTLPFLKDFHIESGNFPVLDLIGVSQKKTTVGCCSGHILVRLKRKTWIQRFPAPFPFSQSIEGVFPIDLRRLMLAKSLGSRVVMLRRVSCHVGIVSARHMMTMTLLDQNQQKRPGPCRPRKQLAADSGYTVPQVPNMGVKLKIVNGFNAIHRVRERKGTRAVYDTPDFCSASWESLG